jgi:hypothetical protein
MNSETRKPGIGTASPEMKPHNPAHLIGTCAGCGMEMVYNVPRLGSVAGFVHKASGRFDCAIPTANEPVRLRAGGVPGRVNGYTGPGSLYLAPVETPSGRLRQFSVSGTAVPDPGIVVFRIQSS